MRYLAPTLWLVAAAVALSADERGNIILLANRAVPESSALAREYMALRGIPEQQLCELDLPAEEAISRADFERLLRDPLLDWLRRRGWIDQIKRNPRRVRPHESGWTTLRSNVRLICSFYGVPVRIEDTYPQPLNMVRNRLGGGAKRNEAAVDSELALLLAAPYPIESYVPNPCYGRLRWDAVAAQHFLLMATRLDGPEPATVRRMMQDAVNAEKTGLLGFCYFDCRGVGPRDGYYIGDFWLEEAAERFRREGFDCIVENSERLFGKNYPMDHPAIYWGWYSERLIGPFQRDTFSFRPGALAYHNHSLNASGVRSRERGWAGPLLAVGAAVSWGAVAEPYLELTPNLSIAADRLLRGLSLAESLYLAIPAFSWQTVVIGDPLYRPFAVPLEDQIRRLEEANDPAVVFAWLRKINLLVREGRAAEALAYARNRAQVRDSALLEEKIAHLLSLNQLVEYALPHYARALELADRPDTAVRIALRYLRLLRLMGRTAEAAAAETALRERWSGSPYLQLLAEARLP